MERLFYKGLTTTLLGVGVLIFCGLSIWKGMYSPAEMSGWFLLGTALLRAKDSLIGFEPTKEWDENN